MCELLQAASVPKISSCPKRRRKQARSILCRMRHPSRLPVLKITSRWRGQHCLPTRSETRPTSMGDRYNYLRTLHLARKNSRPASSQAMGRSLPGEARRYSFTTALPVAGSLKGSKGLSFQHSSCSIQAASSPRYLRLKLLILATGWKDRHISCHMPMSPGRRQRRSRQPGLPKPAGQRLRSTTTRSSSALVRMRAAA